MATENLPFFVYGSLRATFGNYRGILAGKTVREEGATLTGGTMYHGPGFPFLAQATDADQANQIVGEVMWPKADRYDQVKARLDRLEGCFGPVGSPGNMYDRHQVTVTLATGEQVQAWVYFVADGFAHSQGVRQRPVVESGDWANPYANRIARGAMVRDAASDGSHPANFGVVIAVYDRDYAVEWNGDTHSYIVAADEIVAATEDEFLAAQCATAV